MRRLLYILTFLFIHAGCTYESMEAPFMESSEISLIWKGSTQVLYNSNTCQLAYNNAKNEFRVYDDRLADWFIISCDENPTQEGQSIIADVSWTGDRSPKVFRNQSFIVRKVNEDGRVWLWNSKNKIGIIIKHIQ